MAYDLEEQEQIDAIRAWWKRHGNLVLLGITLFVAAVGGTQFWQHYQGKQAGQAAQLFEAAQTAIEGHDLKKAREAAGQVMDQYPRTAYAPRAALLAAQANFSTGDLKSAKAQLEWAMGHAKSDEIRDIARLRLAGVLLDEKNYAEAQKLLETPHNPAFDALYADSRGDVLLAAGKKAEASAAYKQALEKFEPASAYRGLVQMKLDSLGG